MTTQPGPEWLRSVARSAADTLTGRVHISEVYANDLAAAWEADRAALEQARALAEKWRRTTWDKDYGDELAALLAAASGGAA